MKSELLTSCDTFVAMSNVTGSKKVIFGKNSDRPSGEVSGMKTKLVIDLEAIKHNFLLKVQEVIHVKGDIYPEGSLVRVSSRSIIIHMSLGDWTLRHWK